MKANGPVLRVEDLRLAARRRLPLSASASKKKSKNGGRVEVTGEGIERWGIEGIRIGTSDRFGWGRGEYVKRQLLLLTVIIFTRAC